MTLLDAIQMAVSAANDITASLQVEVEHWPWIGEEEADGQLQPKYPNVPIKRMAIVERTTEVIEIAQGEHMKAKHRLAFLYPIEPYIAEGRVDEPIDPRDKIVLPDGSTGPILKPHGLLTPTTASLPMTEVWLG